MRTEMLIGGKWTTGTESETFVTRNPATGEVLAELPEGTTSDVSAAVEAAAAAFGSPEWAGMLPAERAELLLGSPT